MNLRKIFPFLAFLSTYAWGALGQEQACSPFRPHLFGSPSQKPPEHFEKLLKYPSHENELVQLLSSRPYHKEFSSLFKAWERTEGWQIKSGPERVRWLQCLLYYTGLDQNQNGVPDWSAIGDGTLSRKVMPLDSDIDGDGISNLLDPDPYHAAIAPSVAIPNSDKKPNSIPSHLLLKGRNYAERLKAQSLQQQFFDRYRLLIVDYSDEHSQSTLEALEFLIEQGLGREFWRKLKNIEVVYAFKQHSPLKEIASYHPGLKALSIGGTLSYPEVLRPVDRVSLLTSLAHEVGHAFVFSSLTPRELVILASEQGGWMELNANSTADINSFYDERLFRPKVNSAKNKRYLKNSTDLFARQNLNYLSDYAQKNVHEWFAEAFASFIMQRLVAQGKISREDFELESKQLEPLSPGLTLEMIRLTEANLNSIH